MAALGLIGSGNIGSTLARLAVDAGLDVVLSNSRAPQTLSGLVDELGPKARAATPTEAAAAGDWVVVTIPVGAIKAVPREPLAGKTVIDTGNYYAPRDGSPTLSHERPGFGRFAGRVGVFDPFHERLFARSLQAEVERHPEAVPRVRKLRRDAAGDGVAGGVAPHPLHARFPAQVAVVVVLEPFLADHRPRLNAMEGAQLELGFGDLPHVPEHLGGHLTVGVGPDRHGLLDDAGEFALALRQHRQHPGSGVGLDGDRRVVDAQNA